MKVHLHYFSKIKSQKESQNSRFEGFSYYFCMMIEESGSGRPKNKCVLQAGDGGCKAGTGGERLPVQARARQQDGPRSN